MLKRHLVHLFLLAPLFLGGCGSDSTVRDSFAGSSFSNFGPPDGQPVEVGPVVRQNMVFAELNVGGKIPNASIRLLDMNGQELASGTTDQNGLLFFPGLEVPNQFRAVARVGSSPVQFSVVVRDFHTVRRIARITLLSTILDAYQRTHPDLDPAQAEQRVQVALGLPRSLNVMLGLQEPNPVFSDFAFLRAASQQGWEPFLTQLMTDVDAGKPRHFLLSVQGLIAPISGLDADLNRGIEYTRRRLMFHLGYNRLSPGRGLGRPLSPFISLAVASDLVGLGEFLTDVGGGITSNLIGGGDSNAVLGWAANQLGFNYGTSGQLAQISNSLTTVLGLVEDLTVGAAQTQIQAQLTALNAFVVPVQNNTLSLSNSTANATITNLPFSPPASISTLVTSINQPSYQNILTNVQNGMTGNSQVLLNSLQYNLTTALGIDQPTNMYQFPWRQNHLLDIVTPIYNYFANQQVQALNLFSEQAHNGFLNPDPVTGINNMLPFFRTATKSLKLQRQQLPLYTSQWEPITDLEYGIMWSETVHSPGNSNTAFSQADAHYINLVLPDGSSIEYNDFRLPTWGECRALQTRGRYNPSKTSGFTGGSGASYPDAALTTAGLPQLGFWFPNEENNTYNGVFDSDGNLWMSDYGAASGMTIAPTAPVEQKCFQLNHSDGSVQNFNGSSTNPYIFCRTFGETPLVTPYDNSGVQPLTPVPTPVVGRALTASECLQWGIATSVSPPTVSAAPTGPISTGTSNVTLPANSQQLATNVTFQVNLGGSFTVGFGNTQPVTVPTLSYNGTVSTVDTPGNSVNHLREWMAWDSDSQNNVEVLNLPYLDGIAIPRANTAVNVSATVLGQNGVQVTGKGTYTPGALAPHTLQSLQISPRNQIYGAGSGQSANNNVYPLFCTGFYSDRSVASLGSSVTWTVDPANNPANAAIIQGGSGPLLQLRQPSQSNPTAYTLNITATTGSLSDTTTIQIVPSQANTLPTIGAISPTVGPVAGGNPVVVRGANVGTATSVSIGNTPITNFVLNTNSQLTILSMPPGIANSTVEILITTPGGTASAQYTYLP